MMMISPQVASTGFEGDAIEASLNTLEFSMREMNTGGFPKGLAFMLSLMPRWLYRQEEGSPVEALRFEKPLAELKQRLASGELVFENLLKRLILDNGHRTTIVLEPSTTLAAEIQKREEDKLAQVMSH